jgi:hypothetical protein
MRNENTMIQPPTMYPGVKWACRMNATGRTFVFKILLTLICLLLSTACSNGAKNISALKDVDLIHQNERCADNHNPSPGAAISCGNITRECKRRTSEKGFKVC